MPLWIAATLFAAAMQATRMLLLKRLSMTGMGAAAATFARFVWAPPLIALALAMWGVAGGPALPAPPPGFWPWAVAGGVAQICATALVVLLFGQRSFAVGIAFSKTTVLMTVVAGWIALGETVSPAALGMMAVGTGAVVLISAPPGGGWSPWSRATLYGLGSGAFFAVSAVGYRAASLTLAADDPLARAAVTLLAVTALQTAILGGWLLWRDRAGLAAVLRGWRRTFPIGLTSVLGSMGWFTAFTLQTAGLVNAVGQVELVLSVAISVLLLGERITPREAVGLVLLSLSVVGLVTIA
ncbi:DMT family transporter [Jannaschia sp. Os4]|uniref:DMT family transporter n=1 Tax=Jannaschia sp. Os4 TaxID=2807617 RepID=UPI00193963C6|nr:DMT family transporter [Jannaschia sp. Os4]MBM2577827.1 DMT family transporter [Jannaschia sp. Os4]